MKPLPLSNPYSYTAFAVCRRVIEIGWRMRNTLRPPAVWIAGEYFAGNLGDWTMGQAFLEAEAHAGLISYSGSPDSAPRLVMGGGEIGDVFHYERAIQMTDVQKRLGISLMTFYLSVQDRREFVPDQTLKSVVADPEFAAQIDQAGMRYIKMMKDLVRQSLADGWEIINIPFSAVDAMFADTVLRGHNVRRLPFCRNPMKVLEILQTCRRFVAARFHAYIFGLMARVPVVFIAYASKCAQLWKDLGLEPELQVSRLDFCRDPREFAAILMELEGTCLLSDQLCQLTSDARKSVVNAMETVI